MAYVIVDANGYSRGLSNEYGYPTISAAIDAVSTDVKKTYLDEYPFEVRNQSTGEVLYTLESPL